MSTHHGKAASDRRRNQEGVILVYGDHGQPHPYHTETRPHISDSRRIALLKAERELLVLRILADHLDLSDIALTRINDSLEAIRLGLEVKRRDYGMAIQAEVAA